MPPIHSAGPDELNVLRAKVVELRADLVTNGNLLVDALETCIALRAIIKQQNELLDWLTENRREPHVISELDAIRAGGDAVGETGGAQ